MYTLLNKCVSSWVLGWPEMLTSINIHLNELELDMKKSKYGKICEGLKDQKYEGWGLSKTSYRMLSRWHGPWWSGPFKG